MGNFYHTSLAINLTKFSTKIFTSLTYLNEAWLILLPTCRFWQKIGFNFETKPSRAWLLTLAKYDLWIWKLFLFLKILEDIIHLELSNLDTSRSLLALEGNYHYRSSSSLLNYNAWLKNYLSLFVSLRQIAFITLVQSFIVNIQLNLIIFSHYRVY